MRQSFDETTDPSFGAKHLPRVRAKMAEQGLDGLLVPHEDEHQNEYLPDANERLAWATGFTGSAVRSHRKRQTCNADGVG
jgi:Xaa-Pro aminopeptidase